MARRRSIRDKVVERAAGATEPVDLLARRPSKDRRDRTWEREQRRKVGTATYRGIPPALNAEIKEIAHELGVPVGQVARAMLEYALARYHANNGFELTPEPCSDKFTLYPGE